MEADEITEAQHEKLCQLQSKWITFAKAIMQMILKIMQNILKMPKKL